MYTLASNTVPIVNGMCGYDILNIYIYMTFKFRYGMQPFEQVDEKYFIC